MFHVKAHYLGYQNPATNPNTDTRSLNLSDGAAGQPEGILTIMIPVAILPSTIH